MIAKARLGSALALLAASVLLVVAPLQAHGSAPAGHDPSDTIASQGTTVADRGSSTSAAGSTISAPLPTLGSGEVALQQAMPGLFGADEVHPTITGNVISVWSQGSCADLLGVLRAGQWAMSLVHQPTKKGQRTWVATMRKGEAPALLILNGGTGGCSGRITHDTVVPVSVSGAAKAHGDGRFLSFLCLPEWDTDDSDSGSGSGSASPIPPNEFLFGIYTIGGQSFLMVGDLSTKAGTYHVSSAQLAKAADGDDVGTTPTISIEPLPAHHDPLALLTSSLGTMLYPLDLGASKGDQSGSALGDVLNSYPVYAGGREASETVTITSASPLTGRFSATELTDEQHPSTPTLDFSAPFRCDR